MSSRDQQQGAVDVEWLLETYPRLSGLPSDRVAKAANALSELGRETVIAMGRSWLRYQLGEDYEDVVTAFRPPPAGPDEEVTVEWIRGLPGMVRNGARDSARPDVLREMANVLSAEYGTRAAVLRSNERVASAIPGVDPILIRVVLEKEPVEQPDPLAGTLYRRLSRALSQSLADGSVATLDAALAEAAKADGAERVADAINVTFENRMSLLAAACSVADDGPVQLAALRSLLRAGGNPNFPPTPHRPLAPGESEPVGPVSFVMSVSHSAATMRVLLDEGGLDSRGPILADLVSSGHPNGSDRRATELRRLLAERGIVWSSSD